MKHTQTHKNKTFWYYNWRNGLVGIAVGIIIVTLQSVSAGHVPGLRHIMVNIMFSLLISLSITNSVLLQQRLFKPQKFTAWRFAIIYYICNLLGMFIGVELSYMIVSLIFNIPYSITGHTGEYKFTLTIVLIVGTIIYVHNAQKAGIKAQLKQKELDLAKANHLKTQAELQTLQSKINPHFLYNSLNSIASLIHEDADKAEDMTLKLSRLFRYSINSQQENFTTVKEEMEIVNTYLDIEKVRFGDRITFNTTVAHELADKRIPRFLIQPLVENALKHGLNNTAQNGLLEVVLRAQSGCMIIEVADNGKPFPPELDMGYGLQSTYDKLDLLYADNYEMQLINTPRKHIFISLPAST